MIYKRCEKIQFDENKVGNETNLWNVMRLRKAVIVLVIVLWYA